MTTYPTASARTSLRRANLLPWPLALAVLVLVGFSTPVSSAEVPRVLAPGTLPKDARLEPLKDLDGYFPFTPSPTPEEWAKRAARVRRQLLVALGLWPMPTKSPLNAVIHGKIDLGDYTVEKVCFESLPGFYVTGSLFRPKGRSGRLPGVLCPHGHWEDGRFYDVGPERIRAQIVAGEERFENGGRNPLQSRCVQLARMGCVVFHYDMIGYADSQQIPQSLAHGFAKQRPEMNTLQNWGLFSPQAEEHLQSVMGLQTFDSIRALDFLISLPDVDPDRIAVTGASGGGTQTFVLCAIDPRPAVAFPAVMVSTAMQGGCTCENACDLRVRTGNVEFAALFAPKPLGMTAANDWTKEMPTKGFPELKRHFAMLGAPENVQLTPLLQFGHNYNYVSRAAMYRWLNQHLKLGYHDPIVEQDYPRLTGAELTVWDARHPRPEGGPDLERKLLRWLTDDARTQLAQDQDSLDRFRQIFGGAVDVLIGRSLSEVGPVEWNIKTKTDRGDYLQMSGLLRNIAHREELPIVFLYPKQWQGQTVIWLTGNGKAGLYDADGSVRPEIQKLLQARATVVGVDLFEQGEFLADGNGVAETRRVRNPREAAAYTYGYNDTLFAQRVDDILTVISYVKHSERTSKEIDLAGLDGAGPWAAAARAQAGAAVGRAAVDTGGFRFGKIQAIHDVNFLPGGAKYGDLPGLLALGVPGRLWLAGEGAEPPALLKRLYALADAGPNLMVFRGAGDQVAAGAAAWLAAP
ncbi:MAG: acetylxylan esterase [Verrucomicrobia bacterium]|nr:acetylxylan esterase [Verrucomicrobiota bacterium]